MSIFHWLIMLAFLAVIFVPLVKILNRMGYSGWWSLIALLPFGFVVGLWILATSRWPGVERDRISGNF